MSDKDPLANPQDSDTKTAGGGDPGTMGVGNAARHMVDATRSGMFGSDAGPSQGETAGVGSTYAAQLNERPNISNPRNQGPTRTHSRVGLSRIPIMTMASRNTGRKGG